MKKQKIVKQRFVLFKIKMYNCYKFLQTVSFP